MKWQIVQTQNMEKNMYIYKSNRIIKIYNEHATLSVVMKTANSVRRISRGKDRESLIRLRFQSDIHIYLCFQCIRGL